MRSDLIVNILTLQALVSGVITVVGGLQYRPNIHIDDMADAYVLGLTARTEKIAGKVYNVGNKNYRVLDIARMVKKQLGRSVNITIIPTADQRSYRVNSQKIAAELGFIPKHTVDDAIADIVRSYRKKIIPNPFTDKRYSNVKTLQSFSWR
jgi:nucleoside-diphosphate-sugar epimerase